MKKDDVQLIATLAILGVLGYIWYLTRGLSQEDVAGLAPSLKKFNAWASQLP
jgi:hypothetical protein